MPKKRELSMKAGEAVTVLSELLGILFDQLAAERRSAASLVLIRGEAAGNRFQCRKCGGKLRRGGRKDKGDCA